MTEQKTKPEDRLALAPERIGGYPVPRTVQALEDLLKRTKTMAFPLPFRADILPREAQILLYSLGGVPQHVQPHAVGILAGRPYIYADGAVDTAIDMGCKVWTTPRNEILGCLDPQSGCPGERRIKGRDGKPDTVIKAKPTDISHIATATVVKPSGGRYTAYGQCCAHTWAGDAQHRSEMARTRALRKVAIRALGIPSGLARVDDDPEGEIEAIEAEVVEEDPGAGPHVEEKGESKGSPAPAPETSADTIKRGAGEDPGAEGERTGSPEQAGPQASGEPKPATPNGSGGAPGAPSATAEPDDKEDATHVGLLAVPKHADLYGDVATHRDELRTDEQIKACKAVLQKLSLTEGAITAVVKTRYGVALTHATRTQMRELEVWLESRVGIVAAKQAAQGGKS